MGATDTPWPGADGFRQLIRVEQRKLEKVTLWKVSYLTREKDDDGRFVRKPDGRAKDPAAWTKANPGAFQRGRVYFTPAKRG